MSVLPGAEPIDLAGGPVGVLLSHGFTGSTQSMRPWAEHLSAAGFTVSAPRLPGHGTTWQDMNTTRWPDWYGELERAFDDLRARCSAVFAMGLSMGGTLVLRLAELRSDQVAGVVVVNASLASERKDVKVAPLLSKVLPSFPGVGSDIKKEGVRELAYDRVPLKAFASLQRAWPEVRRDLHKINCPVLAYRSSIDHVVEAVSGRVLLEGCAGGTIEERVLDNSYHVATLDNDAPTIFAGSVEFIRRTPLRRPRTSRVDTGSPPPSGRRDNGLTSAEWGALVDLDPRLSEAVLDRLAAVGVAAYVEPAAGAVDTVSRAVALPKRRLDRLWVDTSRAESARSVISSEVSELTALLAEEDPTATAHGFVQPVPRTAATKVLPPPALPPAAGPPAAGPPAAGPPAARPPGARSPAALPPTALPPAAVPPAGGPPRSPATDGADPTDSTDQAWLEIVAGWERESDAPVPPWPVSEDLGTTSPAEEPAPPSRRLRRRSDPAEPDAALPAWLEPDPLEDDGHFVPPPPPPVPKVRRHTVGSLVALALGVVLVFAPNLVAQVPSAGLTVVGIALMLGGAGALVWYMRDAPPTDSGPDDGAVV